VYSLKLLLTVLISLPPTIAIITLGPFDRKGELLDPICRWWTWAILKIGGIRLNVRGLEALDPGRNYIFIANHQSFIDMPALNQALIHFQLRWVAKKELLWIPFFGWALWISRNIIVDRSNFSKAKTSLKKARETVEAGLSVVIFPEGTRGTGGQILPFKRGGFVLALKTRTPIVPVTINGSDAVLSRGDWRIKKGEIEIVVNKPIPVEKYQEGRLRDLTELVHETVVSSSQKPSDTGSYEKDRTHYLSSCQAWGQE
jgi:1-acyl-sn-glycerol-3-phosphate acyltransferase